MNSTAKAFFDKSRASSGKLPCAFDALQHHRRGTKQPGPLRCDPDLETRISVILCTIGYYIYLTVDYIEIYCTVIPIFEKDPSCLAYLRRECCLELGSSLVSLLCHMFTTWGSSFTARNIRGSCGVSLADCLSGQPPLSGMAA